MQNRTASEQFRKRGRCDLIGDLSEKNSSHEQPRNEIAVQMLINCENIVRERENIERTRNIVPGSGISGNTPDAEHEGAWNYDCHNYNGFVFCGDGSRDLGGGILRRRRN